MKCDIKNAIKINISIHIANINIIYNNIKKLLEIIIYFVPTG